MHTCVCCEIYYNKISVKPYVFPYYLNLAECLSDIYIYIDIYRYDYFGFHKKVFTSFLHLSLVDIWLYIFRYTYLIYMSLLYEFIFVCRLRAVFRIRRFDWSPVIQVDDPGIRVNSCVRAGYLISLVHIVYSEMALFRNCSERLLFLGNWAIDGCCNVSHIAKTPVGALRLHEQSKTPELKSKMRSLSFGPSIEMLHVHHWAFAKQTSIQPSDSCSLPYRYFTIIISMNLALRCCVAFWKSQSKILQEDKDRTSNELHLSVESFGKKKYALFENAVRTLRLRASSLMATVTNRNNNKNDSDDF